MVYTSNMKSIQKLIFSISLFSICLMCAAQTPEEFEANYAKRIRLEQINGVYIPVDLEDAFSELNRLSDPSGIAKFKMAPEASIANSHFGLQQWVQFNWGLDEGSRLSHHLKSKGISVPDDMSRVIILMYHRYLNQQPLKLEQEVVSIAKRMEEEKAKRDSLKKSTVIERRPHKD